ncbi:hypothetical protein Vadar_012052 [Vaccinium darrowii]|uniref:Uncharacterized protein n=1 Tax=Vaccinium darrowii TaxID=229202 RepID=A0ACB7Y7E8_9ERIC|nr:hypothetical protein Vadar_012052 [Vaccinium darrowii]
MGLRANPSSVVLLLPLLLSILAVVVPPVSAKLKTSCIQFNYFNDSYNLDVFQIDSPGTIYDDALQITRYSLRQDYLINEAGRILYKSPFKLWEVLLEVVCRRRPGTKIGKYTLLVDWVWALHREGRLLEAVDNRLQKDYVVEEAERILLLGLACSHPTASERPKTQEIVQILSVLVAVPDVPKIKPAFVWASPPMGEEDISVDTTTHTVFFTVINDGSGWTTSQQPRNPTPIL